MYKTKAYAAASKTSPLASNTSLRLGEDGNRPPPKPERRLRYGVESR